MNDSRLADAVRNGLSEACDSLGPVHLTIPAGQIMARADQIRRRRRAGAVAGASGLAGAAVAVALALPAGHLVPESHPASIRPDAGRSPVSGPAVVRLAAWTVTRRADGSIQVTFRQARDVARLQRALRADGVPVSVTYIGQENRSCRGAVGPVGNVLRQSGFGNVQYAFEHPEEALLIRPSALPGVGLQIGVMRGIPSKPSGPWPYPKGSGHPVIQVSLVKASPQCTGS